MSSLYPMIFSTAGVIMLASLAGIVFTWKYLDRILQPRLNYMIALAMGVFVVIIYGLLQEVFHEGIDINVIVAFFIGVALLKFVTTFLPKDSHHHHHGTCGEYAGVIDARRVLVGDAIHNIHDGLILVPAFLVSPAVGIGTALGIFLHEIVQEIAEFFILRRAGYSVKKALFWNFSVSATILLGITLSLWVTQAFHFHTALIALSAGGFSYIVIRDLAPTVYQTAKQNGTYGKHFLAFLIGLLLMFSINVFIPHEHHDDEHDPYPLPQGFELAFRGEIPEMG